MLYRNLASMDVEESIRGNPVDGVVLLMGCDKTTPSLIMGASSVDVPTIGVSGGPMLSGWYRGERIGRLRHEHLVAVGRPARGQDHAGRIP
jgi:L-arabonate dehydrase